MDVTGAAKPGDLASKYGCYWSSQEWRFQRIEHPNMEAGSNTGEAINGGSEFLQGVSIGFLSAYPHTR